jgi:putative transposase
VRGSGVCGVRQRGSENIKGAVFHSDGGGQYYNADFVSLTANLQLTNSMTEVVFDNPHAERLNGIIKNNYLYPYSPKDYSS